MALSETAIGLNILAPYFPGVDLRAYDIDGPTPKFAESTNGSISRLRLVAELAERENLTLRQLYQRLAGARGHWVLAGTPESIADELQRWFENEGADGFNICRPCCPSRCTPWSSY
ncbi:MAG: hypothetical protein RLZZ450_1870 [Pseudomonadota bacterium]